MDIFVAENTIKEVEEEAGLEELPCLAEEKNNREQIEMCFQAMSSETWEALYD